MANVPDHLSEAVSNAVTQNNNKLTNVGDDNCFVPHLYVINLCAL